MKNKGDLHALFIHSDKEPPGGYVFPADIDPAKKMFNMGNAEGSNENVIHAQIKLFLDMTREKDISAHAEKLMNPSLDEIIEITEAATILFIDAAYDRAYLLHVTGFELKDLVGDSKCPVEMVYDNT
jgi:hypothetical protein